MKKRIISMLLAFLMFWGMIPSYSIFATETQNAVSVLWFNPVSETMETADKTELYRGGEMYLSANIRDDISGNIQWQIEAAKDIWVDVQGCTAADLRVSYGMVQSLINDSAVRMRCAVYGDSEYFSAPVTVVVSDEDNSPAAVTLVADRAPVAPDPLPAPVAVPNETETVDVTEENEIVVEEPAETVVADPTPAPTAEPTEEPVPTDKSTATVEPTIEPTATSVPAEEQVPVVTSELTATPDDVAEELTVAEPIEEPVEEPTVEPTVEPTPVTTPIPTATPAETPAPVAVVSSAPVEKMSLKADNSTQQLMQLNMTDTANAANAAADVNVADTTEEGTTYYTITIDYLYGEGSKFKGQRVALPYIAEVPAGDTWNVVVDSPDCVGYTPNFQEVNLATLGKIEGNQTCTVTYTPADVSYTVRHYQQNIDNDDYTWVDTTMATGKTEALTDDAAAKTYTGFTALTHFHEEIAADSSTMIDIYYDRNYYLMSFNLDGGYGVNPIYARYDADISVDDPQKEGWDFAGWNEPIPSTMPAEDKTYTALWTAQTGIGFTVVYWLEDANVNGKYNFWASAPQNAKAGTTVQGETYKDYTRYLNSETLNKMDQYERRYSYCYHADENVVIDGDGSTVVNVYYKRNEYTLKFYYAMENTTANTYHIVGGSTWHFGSYSDRTYYSGNRRHTFDNADEKDLLMLYLNSAIYTYDDWRQPIYPGGQVGKAAEKPTLKNANDPRYVQNFDTVTVGSNSWKLHYISFNAKYGQNINGLWPCDVFNSVTMDQETDFDSDEAFVSAWNGENHVLYTQDSDINNGNQTIKGKYSELDYKVLWDYDEYGDPDDKTVTYLCFWENGAKVGWSIPELYRYNICVPYIESEKDLYLTDNGAYVTREYGGNVYYIIERYSTVDDSNVAAQTAPAINGYDYINIRTSTPLHKYSGSDPTKNIIATQESSPILFDANGNQIYSEAYDVNFFYTRNGYDLTFVNGDITVKTYSDMPFGTDISAKAPSVEYYNQDLKDFYVFSGWYTSPDTLANSRYDLTDAKMPASSLTLYAGWEKVERTVNIYKTEEGIGNTEQLINTVTVIYDELVDEAYRPDETNLEHPKDTTATFIGWFYKDAKGVEHSFDFANMTVKENMNIYAKWRSNQLKTVEINYVVVNNDGTTQIADTETIKMRLGQTRTFEAKTGNSLYEDYRTGHFPMAQSHSITIVESHFNNNDPVTYTFEYKEYGNVPYRVKFTIKELDGSTRPAFRVENNAPVFVEVWDKSYTEYFEEHRTNDKAAVVELFEPDVLADTGWVLPEKYLPNALKLQKVIVPNPDNPTDITANTIEFIYEQTEPVTDPDNPTDPEELYEAAYLVQHWVQNATDTTKYDLYQYDTETGLAGKTTDKYRPISIAGYTYSHDVTDEKKQAGTTLTQGTGDGADVMSGTIVSGSNPLELNFYYTANPYPYKILYLDASSGQHLGDSPITTDSNNNQLTGLYGAKITASPATIEGYNVIDDDGDGRTDKSIDISMEAQNADGTYTANVNTIAFYYELKNADLIISKEVALDEDQMKEEGLSGLPDSAQQQDFTFTIKSERGYNKTRYDYTIKSTESGEVLETGKVEADQTKDEIIVKIKHGQSIHIHGLIMGKYTVTETYVPGFRITVGGQTDAQQREDVSITAELIEANKNEAVNFTNTYPFFTGDLVLGKTVKKVDEINDPTATEPYKVKVTLNPAVAALEVPRTITWTDADGTARTYTVPAVAANATDGGIHSFEVWVPVDGTVTLSGVPAGTFTATEEVKGTVGYIYDYYSVKTYSQLHTNEGITPAAGSSVTGEIHGGHPTTVTFGNTYKKGDLTINKTVKQEYKNDSWTSDTFTFAITGETELPKGFYKIEVNGVEDTVEVAEGKVIFDDSILKTISISKTEGDADEWSDSITFENLPAGYYTVTETSSREGLEKYTIEAPAEKLLVNNTETATVAQFTNTYNRTKGNLQVGKQISIETSASDVETKIDENQIFTFVVEPSTNEQGEKDGTLTGPYSCVVKTVNETATTEDDTTVPNSPTSLSEVDGKITFSLKHNQYIFINDLPVGNYYVQEQGVDGYSSSFKDIISVSENYTAKAVTITTDTTTNVDCINTYPVYYSTLAVEKVVETPADYSKIDIAPQDDEFMFTVTISDYSDKIGVVNSVNAEFYENETDAEPTPKTLTVEKVKNEGNKEIDTLTFSLKAGERLEINLPAGSFTIAETGLNSTVNTTGTLADHYTTAFTVNDETGVDNNAYILASGNTAEVVFTNTYKQHYGDLIVTKENAADSEQVFVYEVKNTQNTENESIYVTVTGNESVTINDLAFGQYTITQVNDWSWRYTDAAKVNFDFTKENNKATFSGEVPNEKTYWINGHSGVAKNTYTP